MIIVRPRFSRHPRRNGHRGIRPKDLIIRLGPAERRVIVYRTVRFG
jgi:hypothetical protein